MPFRAFPEQVQLVHEFYRLKVLITLEQVKTSMVDKKGRILINKTSMVRLIENGGTKGEVIP